MINFLKKSAKKIFKLDDKQLPVDLGYISYTGHHVTTESALFVVAYMSGIRLISETIATLGLKLYRKTDQGRQEATDHPLHYKLNGKPNKYETSLEFIEQVVLSLCIFEAAYIKPDRFGNTANLYCLHPNDVQLIEGDHEPYYMVYEKGESKKYNYDELIKIKSFGGIASHKGFSTAKYGKHALALSIAAEEYGSRYFGQGGRPSGVLSSDTPLKKEQREQLRKSLEPILNPSKENQGRLAVLEAGLKYSAISGTNNEAQMLELRNHQVEEVGRILRIPLSFLMTTSNTTYNNSEQEFKSLISMTLRPYMKRVTATLNVDLLDKDDQGEYYVEFNTAELLQPDTKTRFEIYGNARRDGVMTQNEIRNKENMPSLPGGDSLDTPLNSNKGKETGDKNASS